MGGYPTTAMPPICQQAAGRRAAWRVVQPRAWWSKSAHGQDWRGAHSKWLEGACQEDGGGRQGFVLNPEPWIPVHRRGRPVVQWGVWGGVPDGCAGCCKGHGQHPQQQHVQSERQGRTCDPCASGNCAAGGRWHIDRHLTVLRRGSLLHSPCHLAAPGTMAGWPGAMSLQQREQGITALHGMACVSCHMGHARQ